MASRLASPVSVLDEISDAIEDAIGQAGLMHVAIARADGLVIAHNFPEPEQAKRLAAMSAAIVGTAQKAASDLRQGRFEEGSLKSRGGRLLCVRAGDQAIIAGLARADANVGLVLMALRGLAARVEAAIARLTESVGGRAAGT